MATKAVIQIFNTVASIFTILSNESFFIQQIDIYRFLSLKLVPNSLDNTVANVKLHTFQLYSLYFFFNCHHI